MNQMITNSPEETAKVAEMILTKIDFDKVNKLVVFMLRGKLGGGKTIFAKNVGKLLGVKEIITSPTFIIFNEYRANNKLGIERFLHFDLYRIENGGELDEIDFFDLFSKDSLACIEWPENMGEGNLKKFEKVVNVIDVWFEHGNEENERKISFDLRKQSFE